MVVMMNIRGRIRQVVVASAGLWLVLWAGCGPHPPAPEAIDRPVPLGVTVGSLGRLYQVKAVPVRGYGIVAGLPGTGSAECPPDLRQTLTKYIQQQMPRDAPFDPDAFINSKETAVVEIYGVIPSLAMEGDNFDITVRALSRSQTTSLEGGRLYTAELSEARGFVGSGSYLKTLAKARGPVYIDRLDPQAGSPLEGLVLGGGTVLNSVQVLLVLNEANFYAAKVVRDRINERFGPGTAAALSATEIRITIPPRFRDARLKFVALMRQVYLPDPTATEAQQIAKLVDVLATGPNKLATELALEAIGRRVADSLIPLLDAKDPVVRFSAARCLVNVGDARGLKTLETFATDPQSTRRLEAIEAIGTAVDRSLATPILRQLLAEEDFDVRFAAYRQLRRLQDLSVSRILVAGDFFVETVEGGGPAVVYVSRKDSPRVVIFGAPVPCAANVFFVSRDGQITINGRPDDAYLSLVRKDPRFPRPVGPLRCKRTAADIARTLCERIEPAAGPLVRPGLNIPYCDAVAILRQLCESGLIEAEFRAGARATVRPATGTGSAPVAPTPDGAGKAALPSGTPPQDSGAVSSTLPGGGRPDGMDAVQTPETTTRSVHGGL